MAGLNKLHSLFENENLRRDFTQVQMEQMVSRDVRDNTLQCLEHMELDDETALEAGLKSEDTSDIENKDTDKDLEDDMADIDEGLSDLDVEIESLEQDLMDAAESDTTTKGPLHGMDPAIEEILKTIPEATPKEVTEFFRATEEDGSFEQQTALESEMAVIDMLIPDVY